MLDIDRVKYWDYGDLKFRDFEESIYLAPEDGRYQKLCEKYGNQLDTKFVIGSNEEISLLELMIKDLVEVYDVVSPKEWFEVK